MGGANIDSAPSATLMLRRRSKKFGWSAAMVVERDYTQ